MSHGLGQQEIELIAHCKKPEIEILKSLDVTRVGSGVLFACGDGDRMIEGFDHHRQILRQQGKPDRIHPIFVNGGPINFLKYGPGSLERQFLMGNISGALKLKNMQQVIIYGHWPCGQAKEWGLGPIDVLESQLVVKRAVRELFPNLEVTLRFHVDWGMSARHKSTYHLDRPRLETGLSGLRSHFPDCYRSQ